MGASGSTGITGRKLHDEQLVASLETGDVQRFLELVEKDRRAFSRPIRPRNGDTALHILCNAGCLEGLRAVVEALKAAREKSMMRTMSEQEAAKFYAKVCNVTNDRGRTPLMAAAKSGSDAVVQFLLEHHGNVWLRDTAGGATVLHYAAAGGHDSIVQLLVLHADDHAAPPGTFPPGQPPERLIERGNSTGLTPLHYAVWHKRHRMVTTLVELGASLYASSTWLTTNDSVPCAAGSTPLHVAALSGSLRCSRALMKAYAALVGERYEAAEREGSEPPPEDQDIRLVQDRSGNLPFSVALAHNNLRLLPILHPFTPLNVLFLDERPEDRVLGAPRLVELAAKAAQRILLAQLNAVDGGAGDAGRLRSAASSQPTPAATASQELPEAALRQDRTAHAAGGQEGPAGMQMARGVHSRPIETPFGSNLDSSPGVGMLTAAAGQAPSSLAYPPPPPPPPPMQPTSRLRTEVAEGSRANDHHPSTTPFEQANGHTVTRQGSEAAAGVVATDGLAASRGHSSACELAAQLVTRMAAHGGSTWVERRATWRARLHAPRGLGDRGTPGSDSAHSPVHTRNPSAGLDLAQSAAMALQGDADSDQWMARRSAWRDTMKRHEQQLLEGAVAGSAVPTGGEDVPRPTSPPLPPPSKATPNDRGLPAAGLGAVPRTVHSEDGGASAVSPSRLPPDLALSLRLLGLAGAVADPAAALAGVEGEGGEGQLERQLTTAFHMLRMHRLTVGVTQGVHRLQSTTLPGTLEHSNGWADTPGIRSARSCMPFVAGGDDRSATTTPRPVPSLSPMFTRAASLHSTLPVVRDQAEENAGTAQGEREEQGGTASSSPHGLHTTSVESLQGVVGQAARAGRPVGGSQGGRGPASPPPGGAGAYVSTPSASGVRSSTSQVKLASMVASMIRAAPPALSDGTNEETCGVCMDSGTFVAMKGCPHTICVSCAKELVKLHDLKPALCPFCRHVIMGFSLLKP